MLMLSDAHSWRHVKHVYRRMKQLFVLNTSLNFQLQSEMRDGGFDSGSV